MFPQAQLDAGSSVPLYRQLYQHVRSAIETGELRRGERLPATRELAGRIGLNRTTVTAAYELLESEGFIRRHVGRGSFVADVAGPAPLPVRWRDLFVEAEPEAPPVPAGEQPGELISFATSRPSADLFPVDEIRATVDEVLAGSAAEILQLGSPAGYGPLRRYLMERARRRGEAGADDEVIVTSGCQQALDLLRRVLVAPGDTVAVEDPVSPAIHQVLSRAGARLVGVPVSGDGMDPERLARTLAAERPKLLMVTPDFQNPTGTTLPLAARRRLLELAREAGTVVAEIDIYSELRYDGRELPALKQLDDTGNVIQLHSFSKVAFPGLRVGWILGPRPLVARLADAKQWCDLHTDQLSQAMLCRFAESGRLEHHRNRVIASGRKRLATALAACGKYMPAGSQFTRPQGGMNLWVDLPEPLNAGTLLARAQREGVAYLPGKYFAVSRSHTGGLRLSFAGVAPAIIEQGIALLGRVFQEELDRLRCSREFEATPAMV